MSLASLCARIAALALAAALTIIGAKANATVGPAGEVTRRGCLLASALSGISEALRVLLQAVSASPMRLRWSASGSLVLWGLKITCNSPLLAAAVVTASAHAGTVSTAVLSQ
jgi:hypothetical protein